MAVKNQRLQNNMITIFSGVVKIEDIHPYFEYVIESYEMIGDALGVIVDMTHAERFTLSALRVLQSRSKGTLKNTPIAVVGNKDLFMDTFIRRTEAAVTNSETGLLAFHETLPEAEVWIDRWFVYKGWERSELEGLFSIDLSAFDS